MSLLVLTYRRKSSYYKTMMLLKLFLKKVMNHKYFIQIFLKYISKILKDFQNKLFLVSVELSFVSRHSCFLIISKYYISKYCSWLGDERSNTDLQTSSTLMWKVILTNYWIMFNLKNHKNMYEFSLFHFSVT